MVPKFYLGIVVAPYVAAVHLRDQVRSAITVGITLAITGFATNIVLIVL